MSKSNIEELFAILWAALALAFWKLEADDAFVIFAGISSALSMIAAIVYSFTDSKE